MVTEMIRLRTPTRRRRSTRCARWSARMALTANKAGNSLVVVDYADNVARIRALVRQIDQDRATVLTLDLAHAGAREVATALTQLVAAGEAAAARRAWWQWTAPCRRAARRSARAGAPG
jgi:general secretion pathway protein D